MPGVSSLGIFSSRTRIGRARTVRLAAGFIAGDLGRRVVGRFDGIDFLARVQVGRRMADNEVFPRSPERISAWTPLSRPTLMGTICSSPLRTT